MSQSIIKIRYVGLIENVMGNRQEELHIDTGTTVGELLQLLSQKHGAEFRHSILRNSGELRPSVTIHLGNRDIKELESLNSRLQPDSEITLIITGHPDPGG